jgi:hypothetical protein
MRRLVDRLAAATRQGTVAALPGQHPELMARIAEAEARLGAAREALLEGYAEWSRAIENLENLWAVADLERELPGERRRAA